MIWYRINLKSSDTLIGAELLKNALVQYRKDAWRVLLTKHCTQGMQLVSIILP